MLCSRARARAQSDRVAVIEISRGLQPTDRAGTLVFSTKNRVSWINAAIEEEVWRYIGGICRAHGMTAVQVGGVDDHVHLLLGYPPTVSLSDAVKKIKGSSSKWMSERFEGFAGFRWQDGYGAFSIGQTQVADTVRYIQRQREHHRRTSFEVEYRRFLEVHEIETDERYVFG